MTQHYKDANGDIYSHKPEGVEVEPISMAEVRAAVRDTKTERISEIRIKLSQIDSDSQRANRAVNVAYLTGNEPSEEDKSKLIAFEEEAELLRQELSVLHSQ